MTIRRLEPGDRATFASRLSGAVRLGYVFYAAWSASRGSRSLQNAVSTFVQKAAVLAIGLCFPVSPGRRTSIGWQPVAVPSLARAATRPLRTLDR